MPKSSTNKDGPNRKTLVQQQAEITVRDPAAHAKNQVRRPFIIECKLFMI